MNIDLGNQPVGYPPTLEQKKQIQRQLRSFSPDFEGSVAAHFFVVQTLVYRTNGTISGWGMIKDPSITELNIYSPYGPIGGSVSLGRLSKLKTGNFSATGVDAHWKTFNFQGCSSLESLMFGGIYDAQTGKIDKFNVSDCPSLSLISGVGVDMSACSVDFAGLSSLKTVVLKGTKLTSDQVDDIIITLDALDNVSGVLNLSTAGTNPTNRNSSPTEASSGSLYQLTGVKDWVYSAP